MDELARDRGGGGGGGGRGGRERERERERQRQRTEGDRERSRRKQGKKEYKKFILKVNMEETPGKKADSKCTFET